MYRLPLDKIAEHGLCWDCPSGAVCDKDGTVWENLETEVGWWRADNTTWPPSFYRCLIRTQCNRGLADANGSPCSGHRTGPICAVCEEGYSSPSGTGDCQPCPDRTTSYATSITILVIFLVLILVMYWIVLRTDRTLMLEAKELQKKRRENEWAWFEDDYMNEEIQKKLFEKDATLGAVPRAKPNFTYKLKILLGFFQITTNLAFALDIPWPTAYQQFITQFTMLNFDFIQWSSVGCVVSTHFYTKFLAITMAPLAILVLVFLFYWVPRYIRSVQTEQDYELRRGAEQRSRRQFWKLFLFTLFLIYPGVSSTVLRLFVCRDINGVNYLLADFTVECGTSEWRTYALIDIFFIALYPIGIPFFFWVMIYSNRTKLRFPDVRVQLGFLYEAYTAQMWWFELIDMANKLILTSIIAFLPADVQMPIGFGWAVLYLDILLILKPYIRKGDDRLHLFAQLEICMILLAGWIFYSMQTSTLDTTSDVAMSVILIVVSLGLLLMFLYQIGILLKKMFDRKKEKKEREKQLENEDAQLEMTNDLRALRLPKNALMTRNPLFEANADERKEEFDYDDVETGGNTAGQMEEHSQGDTETDGEGYDDDERKNAYNEGLGNADARSRSALQMPMSSSASQHIQPQNTWDEPAIDVGDGHAHNNNNGDNDNDEMFQMQFAPRQIRRE